MTVDMLAATFFWPEGTLLGSRHPHPDDAPAAETQAEEAEHPERPENFWSAVTRPLWRPAPRPVLPPD